VSNEGGGILKRHIEKKGIRYPIASISGGKIDEMYGVKGFPSGALVDGYGRVVWMGHPGGISREEIEKALETCSILAPLEGDDYKKINKSIASTDYGAALKAIDKALAKNADDSVLNDGKKAIEALLSDRLEQAEAAHGSGDFGSTMLAYESIQTMFKGHAAADNAKDLAKVLSKNPAAKDELAASKMMLKGDEAQREGDFEKAAKLYGKIVTKYPDAKCSQRADAYLGRHSF
jgi:tetratricopeptide (TPR) repeat protein